jgi:acyl-CoA synthetase (AMP-forming)/AMP-acid ligase II
VGAVRNTKPSVFIAPPRVWSKFEARASKVLDDSAGFTKKLKKWAGDNAVVGVATEYERNEAKARGFGLAKKLVFNKILEELGLGACSFLGCAGAPLTRAQRMFWLQHGVVVNEFFGAPEVCGVALGTRKGEWRDGCVGVPLSPQVCVLLLGDEGEIVVEGPTVFLGYLKDHSDLYRGKARHDSDSASAEKPATAADEEQRPVVSSFSTGFTGAWVDVPAGEGHTSRLVRITGRKCTNAVSSLGVSLCYPPVEKRLQLIPAVSKAVVVGDGLPFFCAPVSHFCS